MKWRFSVLFIVVILASLSTFPHQSVYAEIEHEEYLEGYGIIVDPEGFGPKYWDISFIPENERDYLTIISATVPIVGTMISNGFYKDTSWELAIENAKWGVYEGGSLILKDKKFENVEAIANIKEIQSGLNELYRFLTVSSALPSQNDQVALEAIKILKYGLIEKSISNLSTNEVIFLNIPFEYTSLFAGLFNEDGSIKWTESGKAFNNSISRYDGYLRIMNDDEVHLLPILGADLPPDVSEKSMEKLLYDIHHILLDKSPVFYPSYATALVNTFHEKYQLFYDQLKRAEQEAYEIEQKLLQWRNENGSVKWRTKTDISPDHNWEIVFSKPLDPATITENTVYIEHKGARVEGLRYRLEDSGKKLIVKAPENGYQLGQMYTLFITGDVKSAADKSIPSPIMMNFIVGNHPEHAGNLNVGSVAYDDQFVYYADDTKLVRESLNGSKNEILYRLTNARPTKITLFDEWIYFVSYDNNGNNTLYRMTKDGKDVTEIKLGNDRYGNKRFISELAVANEYGVVILLRNDNTYLTQEIIIVDHDLQVKSLYEEINSPNYEYFMSPIVQNNEIHVARTNEDLDHSKLYRLNLNDLSFTQALDTKMRQFYIVDDWIYYLQDGVKKSLIYKVKKDGTQKQLLYEGSPILYFTMTNTHLYLVEYESYSKFSYNLVELDINGNNKKALTDLPILIGEHSGDIVIVGDSIYNLYFGNWKDQLFTQRIR